MSLFGVISARSVIPPRVTVRIPAPYPTKKSPGKNSTSTLPASLSSRMQPSWPLSFFLRTGNLTFRADPIRESAHELSFSPSPPRQSEEPVPRLKGYFWAHMVTAKEPDETFLPGKEPASVKVGCLLEPDGGTRRTSLSQRGLDLRQHALQLARRIGPAGPGGQESIPQLPGNQMEMNMFDQLPRRPSIVLQKV